MVKMSPVHSADTLQVQNFVEITLSHNVSEINVFNVSHRNSRWPPKVAGKVIFVKSQQYTLDTLEIENFDKITLSHMVKEIEANLFFHFWRKCKTAVIF